MYAITGVTGHVGGATARELLAAGEPVRVVVRDQVKGRHWTSAGADVAVADFADRDGLARAFHGCAGVFAMLPTIPTATDADHRRLADTIAGAVADGGVPHVVVLSSVGADLAEGTGPIRWLHRLENRLRDTGVVLTTIRSAHFQENVEAVLGAAVAADTYPVFGSADVPTPRIATRDIGALAAQALPSPPPTSEIIDLDGPHYTERQIADKLAAVLGKPLHVVTIPGPGWIGAMTDAGVPAPLAAELAELYDAEQRGALRPCGDRTHRCTTEIDEILPLLVGLATA